MSPNTFMEQFPCARDGARCRGYNGKQGCYPGLHSQAQESANENN